MDAGLTFSPATMVTAISIGASLVVLLFVRRRYVSKGNLDLPPGDLGLPLLGETLAYISNPLEWGLERRRRFGTPFLTHIFFQPTIDVSEDDDVKYVWDSERRGLTSICWPSHIQDMLGRGALTSISGPRHRALRRLLMPAFGPASIQDYVDVIDETTKAELAKWASSGKFHSSETFKEFALRVLFRCIFPDAEEDVLQRVRRDFPQWLGGFNAIVPYPLPGTLMGKSMAARGRLLALLRDLVEKFKRKYPPDSKEAERTLLGRMYYGTDDEGNRLTMKELCDNILVIIFAGHDTTAASMGSFLHNIFVDKRVAEALIEEVNGAAFKGPRLNFDELRNAPLLNAFMAESWRRDPPVANGGGKILHRAATYKGWTFPKGMVFRYNVALGAYNEKRYPQPSEFKIDRFLPRDHPLVTDGDLHAADVDYNAMSPAFPIFGGGNHSCLGSHFARLESRVLLTRMFQLYHVEVKNSGRVFFPMINRTVQFRLTPR